MSQSEKAALYKELQAAGVKFDKHYREYKTAELKVAVDKLRAMQAEQQPEFDPAPAAAPEPEFDPAATAAAYAQMAQGTPPLEHAAAVQQRTDEEIRQENALRNAQQAGFKRPQPAAPRIERDPNEMPGQRLNTGEEMEPIRTDEFGRVWYQEEVLKPAYPKPRGRRVLQYMDSGVKEVTTKVGQYVETFEVAGDLPSRPSEVKITLPSYQVGIYKDRRFPFKIHTYNGNQGFDLFEVQNFYGGSELVPTDIKRVYVENVLCYDIRTTVRAIQAEHRQLQLQGKVK